MTESPPIAVGFLFLFLSREIPTEKRALQAGIKVKPCGAGMTGNTTGLCSVGVSQPQGDFMQEETLLEQKMREQLEAAERARMEAITSVQAFLFSNYEPVKSITEGITLTTQEIYDRLQDHYPSSIYSATDVASWMISQGFATIDKGDLKLEWLMRKRV